MFLPFFPLIIALAGLSVIGTLPQPPLPLLLWWEMLLLLVGLLLLGLILGGLSGRALGSRSPMSFSRRRMVMVALWLALLSSFGGLASLRALLSHWPAPDEAATIILLFNYWIGDSLAMQRTAVVHRREWPAQGRLLLRNLGVSMPILIILIGGMGLAGISLEGLLLEAGIGRPPPWLEMAGGMLLYLAMAAILVPLLITFCWRLEPLKSAEAERLILRELAANGVSASRVLDWPAWVMGHATAGVIGMLPRFRYLLFANILSEALTPDEIRSVIAHEAAHLKHHHLWYFFAAIFSFILFINLLIQGLLLAGLWLGYTLPPWLPVVLELAGLLIFFRFGVGALSRNFERQADGCALQRHGLENFKGAILKIGRLNGIPVEADNWHHFGIGRRIEYLREASQQSRIIARHDKGVFRIKAGLLAVLALFMATQAVFSSSGVVSYMVDKYWQERVELITDPTPAEVQNLNILAMQAYRRGELGVAESYFRVLINWAPGDPVNQNNLAWLLVTRPESDPARLKEGLSLAVMASGASPSAYIWDTLAEAYFRLGRLGEAASAARTALDSAEREEGRGDAQLSYYRSRLKRFTVRNPPGTRGISP